MSEPSAPLLPSDAPEPGPGLPRNLKRFLVWVGAALVATIGVTWGLFKYSGILADKEKQEKELATVERAVSEQRARDRRELDEYAQVDAKKGIYRIAVSRALELVVANPRLLDPVVQPSPPPPVPPAAPGAPAPKGGSPKKPAPSGASGSALPGSAPGAPAVVPAATAAGSRPGLR